MLDSAPILVLQDEIQSDDNELPVEQHPTDDESLPSYQCQAYKDILPHLMTMRELYDGQKSWMANGKITSIEVAKKYLPKEAKEDNKSYENRLIRSPFENFLEPAIKGFAGLMSDVSLGDEVYPSITDHQTNIDLQGNNLETFWTEADIFALRDGMTAILTEYPRNDEPDESYEVQQRRLKQQEFRPYFSLVERIDIPNWDIEFVKGKLTIQQITIRETHCLKKKRFGSKTVTRYRVLMPGRWEVWRIVKGNGEKAAIAELIDEGELLAKNQSMAVPLVPYSPSTLNPFEAPPPLLDLAALNVRHFQSTSDYYEVMRKCNLPVPVRKGLVVEGNMDFSNLPPVVIGPNSVVDIPQSGDFKFAEPSGAAIGATRTAILDLEAAILRRTLAFLSNTTGNRTATESLLRSSQSQSIVLNLAIRKESVMESCFDFWAQYEGSDKGGRPEVHKDILMQALDAQTVSTLSGLVDKAQLSLKTFLQLLISGKVLPRDLNVEEEIEQAKQEKQENIDMTLSSAIRQQQAFADIQSSNATEGEDENDAPG